MKHFSRALIVALCVSLLGAFGLLTAEPAFACTQPVGGHPVISVAERTQRTAIVLVGTVTAVAKAAPNTAFETATIEVQQYLKGTGGTTVQITGFGSSAMCLASVFAGQQYLFFAEPGAEGVFRARHFAFADAVASASSESIAQAQAALRPDPLGGATAFPKVAQPTDINVMLDWTPNTNHIGLYVALANGYYTEAGLNVTIQPAGDVAVDQVVASGRAQFGVGYQEGLTYSRASGLPIVSIAAIIQSNTSGFATLADKKPLKTPADLVGLRYGGFGSAIERPIIEALIACSGKTGTVEQIDIGFVEPFPLMERDRIDVVWLFYAWDGIRAGQQGLKLDMLMLRDYPDCVPDYYTPVLTTSEQMISERADVVAAFVAATARGYADAIKNPAAAADILLTAAPDLDPALVKASAAWLAAEYQGKAQQWGWQEPATWQKFTDFMVKSGALEKPIEVEKAFTNAFLPK